MRWGDFFVDRAAMVMRIQGKGSKTADVPAPDPVWAALMDWRTSCERTRKYAWTALDPVFPSLSPRNRIRTPEADPSGSDDLDGRTEFVAGVAGTDAVLTRLGGLRNGHPIRAAATDSD